LKNPCTVAPFGTEMRETCEDFPDVTGSKGRLKGEVLVEFKRLGESRSTLAR